MVVKPEPHRRFEEAATQSATDNVITEVEITFRAIGLRNFTSSNRRLFIDFNH